MVRNRRIGYGFLTAGSFALAPSVAGAGACWAGCWGGACWAGCWA